MALILATNAAAVKASEERRKWISIAVAALAAQECEACGISVCVPDEGVVADDGRVLCHGCS